MRLATLAGLPRRRPSTRRKTKPMSHPGDRYSGFAIFLHWIMALGIFALIAIGLTMKHVTLSPMRLFQLYQLHKSIGVVILLAAILRLGWRLMRPPPELPASMPALERKAAHGGHLMLYLFLFALPLSGWALVSVARLNIPTVLFGVIPWPHLPVLSTLPDKAPAEAVFKLAHRFGAWLFIAVIIGHVAAALRHHFLVRDDVLARMLPRRRKQTVAVLALLAVALVAVPPRAEAANWTLDPAQSTLGFSGTQAGEAFKGKFTRFIADIAFDPDHLETSHIHVTVDVASAVTGDPQKDTALPEKDWFAARDFPKAQFESNTIRRTAPGAYEAVGDLTLRGVSHSLTLPFTLEIDGAKARAKGHVPLIRTDYGVGQGDWASGQWVALEVDVTIDVTATANK